MENFVGDQNTESIMRNAITSLFVIYLTFIIAITESKADMRFPADSSIVRGILNQSDYEFILYYVSEDRKVVNYTVSVDDGSCGEYQLQLDDDSTFDNNFHIIPLKSHTILLLPLHSSQNVSNAASSIEILDTLSCQKNKVVLPSKNKLTDYRITKYVDGFDIYFKDSSLCGRGICRESFDFQGNLMKTPLVKFESNADDADIPLVMPIGTKLRSNNHLALTFPEGKVVIHVVKDNELNLVKEIEPEFEYGPSKDVFTPQVSMSHDVISIAARHKYESLNIIQLDSKGKVKFETIVNFGYYIRTAKVLNALDGGAYVVGSQCARDHCDDDDNMYSIRKINANGKEVGSLNVTLPLPGIVEDVSFYEKNGSFCLSRAQLNLGASLGWYFKRVDVHEKCFTDKDF